MRVAIKFAYYGPTFSGSQVQNSTDLRTVEGVIISSLLQHNIIKDPKTARFQLASRTDAGVSALGNVLAFDSDYKKDDILNILNSKIPDCWFYGFAVVDENFKPRHAKTRWYRYHLFKEPGLEYSKLVSIVKLFIGEHDLRNFSNPSLEMGTTVRGIESIEISEYGALILIDVKSSGFLWNQVRRMVSAWVKYAKCEISSQVLENALKDTTNYCDLGLAPAKPLILMDIEYDFQFEIDIKLLQKTKLRLSRYWQDLNIKMSLIEYIMKKL